MKNIKFMLINNPLYSLKMITYSDPMEVLVVSFTVLTKYDTLFYEL